MMHPVKYHLTNKLVWMSRQLREMNNADDILKWADAMKAVHSILVETMGNNNLLDSDKWRSQKKTWSKNFIPSTKDHQTKEGKGWKRESKRRVVLGRRTTTRDNRVRPPVKMELELELVRQVTDEVSKTHRGDLSEVVVDHVHQTGKVDKGSNWCR